MRNIFIAILMLISFSSFADNDFELVENNLTLKHDKFGFTVRDYTDGDYFHYEGTYMLNDIFTVGFRAADNQESHPEFALTDPTLLTEDTWEFRSYIQMDNLKYQPIKNLTLQFRPRMEYRVFKEDDDTTINREDYMRFRAAGFAFYEIGKLEPWAGVEFYNNIDEGRFEQSRYLLGANYTFTDNIKFGPYIEKRMDSDWNDSFIMVATQLTVTF